MGRALQYKARLAALGLEEIQGVDYHKVCSTVASICSIRIALLTMTANNMEVYQFNVKNAFFNGKFR